MVALHKSYIAKCSGNGMNRRNKIADRSRRSFLASISADHFYGSSIAFFLPAEASLLAPHATGLRHLAAAVRTSSACYLASERFAERAPKPAMMNKARNPALTPPANIRSSRKLSASRHMNAKCPSSCIDFSVEKTEFSVPLCILFATREWDFQVECPKANFRSSRSSLTG